MGEPRSDANLPGHGEPSDASTCAPSASLHFSPAIGDESEAYVCFGFDAFDRGTIDAVHWYIGTGAVMIHHALLYAVTADFPDGPVRCNDMPSGAVGLHVWSPGGGDLELPGDTGLLLPVGTQRFVVQVHALRVNDGAIDESEVTICRGLEAPNHLAALMATTAPVPAIRPNHEEQSSSTCTLAGNVHLWSAWPHMHLAGKEISGELVHGTSTTTLVDVVPWDFQSQKTYPLRVDASAGDQIRVSCKWANPTPDYILPGPLTSDEMCNLGFIAWPATAASCR